MYAIVKRLIYKLFSRLLFMPSMKNYYNPYLYCILPSIFCPCLSRFAMLHWDREVRTLIIWLNGAFGAGKTQTAFELRHRLGDAFVYDPENMGYCIRQNVPDTCKYGDFQDYPMWRSFNYEMLD